MATVRAFIHHYDEFGRKTKPAERVFALLAVNERPQVLTISLSSRRAINITRAELERVLAAFPQSLDAPGKTR